MIPSNSEHITDTVLELVRGSPKSAIFRIGKATEGAGMAFACPRYNYSDRRKFTRSCVTESGSALNRRIELLASDP